MLTALRPKNEGLLPTCDMHQELTDQPRDFFYVSIKLLIGQGSARLKEFAICPGVIAKHLYQSLIHMCAPRFRRHDPACLARVASVSILPHLGWAAPNRPGRQYATNAATSRIEVEEAIRGG